MTDLKTLPNDASVPAFLAQIANEQRRADGQILMGLLREAAGAPAVMWGDATVGFGQQRVRDEDGREVDSFALGFSPRKRELVLYVTAGFAGKDAVLARLGKHKVGKGCLYIKRLSDIDLAVLRELIAPAPH